MITMIAAAALSLSDPAVVWGQSGSGLDGPAEASSSEGRDYWDGSVTVNLGGGNAMAELVAQTGSGGPDGGNAPRSVAAPGPRRHVHYSLGRRDTDPDNAVSKASLIRHAGMTGHLINVLPPVALAGSGRLWGEMLAGEYGDDQQTFAFLGTILLPIAIVAIVGMAIMSMADNVIDGVDDAFKPEPRRGVTAD